MNNSMLQVTSAQSRLPALVAAAGERALMRFLEFFAANIRNPHTRWPGGRAPSCRRSAPCSRCTSPPGSKPARARSQRRASSNAWPRSVTCAIRHLFDWLVTGQVVPVIRPARYAGPGTL